MEELRLLDLKIIEGGQLVDKDKEIIDIFPPKNVRQVFLTIKN